jgi:putative nucleotidyltransferase with HDIG domain
VTASAPALLEDALAAQHAGAWQRAALALHEAYRAAVAAGDAASLVESILRLGHCYRLSGERQLAAELLELSAALEPVRARPGLLGRALNGLAALAQDGGDLAEAERLYRRAHECGRRAGDSVLIGETAQNLGTVANIRGLHGDALQLYLEGLTHLERAGGARGRIAALNNLGMLAVDTGRLDEGARYFDRALEICAEVGDVFHAGSIQINRVELFLARGDLERARACCEEGYEVFSRLGHAGRRAEALKCFGVVHRASGKPHLAEVHLRQAIGIAAAIDPLLEAESQRELARVLRQLERNRQALGALNRAHALFTQLQAGHDVADVDGRLLELEGEFLSLVAAWSGSIEAKDRYTQGHCERVAEYACRIADRVGLPPGERVWFRMGAFLHDVGKMEVPAEILNKPGRLSPEERGVMERHAVLGDQLLATVEFPWDIRPMVRSHHERWDGRGYPDGLAGDRIPLAARILRVADVFDALTTARSYRIRLKPEQALNIMRADAGSFDPEVFAVFVELFPALAEGAGVALAPSLQAQEGA